VIRRFVNNPDAGYLGTSAFVFKNAGRVNTYLYEGDDVPIQHITNCLADARVGDWVMYQSRYGAARTMVIYRDNTKLPNGKLIS
jgi:hypothetical protein